MKNPHVYFTRLLRYIVIDYSLHNNKRKNMTYEKLSEEVSKLLNDTEEKMNDLIARYNDHSIEGEIDTVDLSMKFRELSDYIEDYSN